MAKQGGLGDNFYVGGFDLSGDIASFGKINGGTAQQQDMTDITQSGHARAGLERDGGMDVACFFDPVTSHPVLSALPTADVQATYFRGVGLGNAAASLNAKQINYDWNRGADGSLTGAVSLQGSSFGLEWGVQLTPGRRVDGSATAAGPGNSVDTLASAAFGGQMYVHLFAFTGTSVTIKLQDSSDNITFADISGTSLTTAALTTPQAVRVTVPNTTTLRRYLAIATVGTFSNADFAVNVHKNEIAGIVF
jgi:hypothetical protein